MSMNINYPLEIDVNRGGLSTTVAVQGDHIGRKINVTLISAGQIVDLTGCSAMVKCSYNNKTIAVNSCEIKTNIVIVTLTKTMLAYSGKLELQVTVTGSGGEIISTPIIYVLVSKSISTEPVEQVEDFSILADLTERIMKTLSDPAVGSAEVKDARGAYTLLGDRLDAMDDTYINFLDAPNHAKPFTKAQNWNLYSDIKLATGEDHVTLSGAAENSSQCGLLNLDKTLHCDADGYSTVLFKIRMRAVDCNVTVNIRDGGWFNNQCIIDSNVENWERASTYLTKELAKNEWVTAWVVVGGVERDITKVGLQAVSPATAFKIEIASIDVYYSQDSLSGDVQKASGDISQLQSNDRQLDSKITNLQTDNTENKENIETLQTDVSSLQTDNLQNKRSISTNTGNISTLFSSIQEDKQNISDLQEISETAFSCFSSTDTFWTGTEAEIDAWAFKPNSMYSISNTRINRVKGIPNIEAANIMIFTFGGNNIKSPTHFNDVFTHETGSDCASAGTTQLLCSNKGQVFQRYKDGSTYAYSSWQKMSSFDVGSIQDSNITNTLPNSIFSDINSNSAYRVTAGALTGAIEDRPFGTSHSNYSIITIKPLLANKFNTVQFAISSGDNSAIEYRTVNANGEYGDWIGIANKKSTLSSMGQVPSPPSYSYDGFGPNTIYRLNADTAGHVTGGPDDISEFHSTNQHTSTILSPFSNNKRGAIQILSAVSSDLKAVRLVYRAFANDETPDTWHGVIDTENLNHFIKKDEYIKSLEARIAALEKQ